jgi:hypothetical protein
VIARPFVFHRTHFFSFFFATSCNKKANFRVQEIKNDDGNETHDHTSILACLPPLPTTLLTKKDTTKSQATAQQ